MEKPPPPENIDIGNSVFSTADPREASSVSSGETVDADVVGKPADNVGQHTLQMESISPGKDIEAANNDVKANTGIEGAEGEEGKPVVVVVDDKSSDGRSVRSWFVLFAAFSASVWAMAMPAVWGIFVRTMLVENTFPGATSFQLQMAGTLTWGIMVLTTIFVGPLSDKVPPQVLVGSGAVGMAAAAFATSYVTALWQVYLCSTLYGIAGSCVYTPAPQMISQWFAKRRALAMGIFVSGSGIGSFINAAVAQACISAGGWRFALKIMAAMLLGWMFPAAMMFKRKGTPVPRKGPFITFVYFKNFTFTMVFLSVLSIFFAFFMPQGYIPIMLYDGGYGNAAGAAVVSAFSACMAVGRIIGGFFADRVGEINMFVVSCLVPFFVTLVIWLPAPTNIATCTTAAILWALFGGTPLVSMPIIAGREFGIGQLGSVLGILYVSFGPGELFGNALLGLIVDANTYYDASGTRIGANYRPMLAFVVCMWFLGLVFISVLRYRKVGWKLGVRV